MRVIISGGGTGGHIYPALAIIEQLRASNEKLEVIYVGSEKGLERDLVQKAAIPGMRFEAMEVSGFRRSLSLSNFKTIWLFLKSIQKSKSLLKSFRPDIVIGTGGYVCAPIVYAAAREGVPTIVHEQNAVAGLTNRFLSRSVSAVAVSFRGSEKEFSKAKRVVYTGNPRASQVRGGDGNAAREKYGIHAQQKVVLIVGGSRGALAINQAARNWVSLMKDREDVHVLIVSGERYFEEWKTLRNMKDTRVKLEERLVKIQSNVTVVPYVHDMPDVLAATHVAIGRAGASSLAEWTALGMPTILIPSPNVTNNHQEANARSLVEAGAAQMIREPELTVETLDQAVQKMIDNPIFYKQMCECAKNVGQADAAHRMADLIREIKQ